jgi:hypothetical protein
MDNRENGPTYVCMKEKRKKKEKNEKRKIRREKMTG